MPKADGEMTIFVQTSAGRVSCREKEGGGAALVLLHGSSFSKEVFEPLMHHPALAGIRSVAIDLPGHGRSEDAGDPGLTYRIPGFAAVVREVLAALRLEGCMLLGWSLGGDIAMEFLEGEPIVCGVASVSAPPVPAGILGRLRGYTLTGALLASKARFTRAEAMRFEMQCIGKCSDGRFVETLQRTDARMRPQLARSAFTDTGRDQRKAVRSTRLPVWLVAGDQDPLVRISYVKALGDSCGQGRSPWIVPDAGHAPFLDSPDEFAARLADFVRLAARAREDQGGPRIWRRRFCNSDELPGRSFHVSSRSALWTSFP